MVTLAPKMTSTISRSAHFLDENKQKSRQHEEMRKTIELNPKNAQALNYLGYTYAEIGNHLDEAERLVKRALAVEPEDGFYVDSLGWVYYQQGRLRQSGPSSSKARSTLPAMTRLSPSISVTPIASWASQGSQSRIRRRAQEIAGHRPAIAAEGQNPRSADRDGGGAASASH